VKDCSGEDLVKVDDIALDSKGNIILLPKFASSFRRRIWKEL
jgi:hypothetical protein